MNKEKIYLGISLGFNSSACVMSTTRGMLSACSQERLVNKKNTKMIPYDAIEAVIKSSGVKVIDEIAIGHYQDIREDYFNNPKYKNPDWENEGETWKDYIFTALKECDVNVKAYDIYRCDHQTAHRNCGFAFYGRPKTAAYGISSDGFGDGLSASISYMDGDREDVISTVRTENSVALVYQFVTGALGFKEHEHEGKITGLAAWGKPIWTEEFEKLYDKVDYGNGLQFKHFGDFVPEASEQYHKEKGSVAINPFSEEDRKLINNNPIYDFEDFLRLKMTVYNLCNYLIKDKGATREDLAATVQHFAEKWTLNWLNKAVKEETGLPAYLAGGLFANVKINQRIKDSGLFSEVLVAPPMGDEGTCAGACVTLMKIKNEYEFSTANQNEATISGPALPFAENKWNEEAYVKGILLDLQANKKFQVLGDDWTKEVDVKVLETDDALIGFMAKALADNKVVCHTRGTMEFGPRALCHRTIFYNADAYETNGWLNKKLNRSEFMPFAPVTLDKYADDLFERLDGGRQSAQFMTMTFDAKEEFVKNYKAACHVDNTARPQIVSYNNDKFCYQLLEEYNKLTGKKALINTSFNRHGEPIVWEEKKAIETWLDSGTEILTVGNVVLELKHPEPHETEGDGKWNPLKQ